MMQGNETGKEGSDKENVEEKLDASKCCKNKTSNSGPRTPIYRSHGIKLENSLF